MNSTDHSLNNPTRVDPIQLLQQVDAMKFMNVEGVTQDFYDRMETPDPHVCYVITDQPGKMYYGSIPIKSEKNKTKYVIGQEWKDEWILYAHEVINWEEHLIEICRYDDPQKAINALEMCNRVGSHSALNIQIYNILIQYISKAISINSAILGIMSILGYKDDPHLQSVIQTAYSYHVFEEQKVNTSKVPVDLPAPFKDVINQKAQLDKDSLYSLYARIYDVFIKNALFKDESLLDDMTLANLNEPIEDILTAWFQYRGIFN